MSNTSLNTTQNKFICIATYVYNPNDTSGKDLKKIDLIKKKERIFEGSLEIQRPLTLPVYI